jgi:hypothetical protein
MSQVSAQASPKPAVGPFSAAMNAVSVRAISRAIAPNSWRIQRHMSVVPA